jgi:transcriptional regulator with XRE-family HTH domain
MNMQKKQNKLPFGLVRSASELGTLMRAFRKSQHLTLEKVSGITNSGMRFLSELERGKETAELGKTLEILNKLGLEVIIQPRGYYKKTPNIIGKNNLDEK